GGADDAHRHRLLQPEGASDRNRPLAHLDLVGISEGRRHHPVPGNADDGEVRLVVRPHDLARELALVVETDSDRVRALGDVEVTLDGPPGGEDDARADPRPLALALGHLAEVPLVEVAQALTVLARRRALAAEEMRGGDTDDSRAHALGDPDE